MSGPLDPGRWRRAEELFGRALDLPPETREAMVAAGLDMLFVTDPSNQAWLTGYDGWSFYVHQGVLLGLESDPIWWGRNMDALGAVRTCWAVTSTDSSGD